MAGALRRRRSPPETLSLEGTYTDNLTDPSGIDFGPIGPLEYPKLAPTALKCHRYIAFMGPQSANEVDDAPEFATFVTFWLIRLR